MADTANRPHWRVAATGGRYAEKLCRLGSYRRMDGRPLLCSHNAQPRIRGSGSRSPATSSRHLPTAERARFMSTRPMTEIPAAFDGSNLVSRILEVEDQQCQPWLITT